MASGDEGHSPLTPLFASRADSTSPSQSKVLVLGGTGFVGRHIIDELDRKNISYVATSTQGKEGNTVALDLTSNDAPNQLLDICKTNGITAIVSTVGSIFTEHDYETNSASGRTAAAAFGADPSEKSSTSMPTKYIFIGNSPRVRNVCNIVDKLNEYARGKEESEIRTFNCANVWTSNLRLSMAGIVLG